MQVEKPCRRCGVDLEADEERAWIGMGAAQAGGTNWTRALAAAEAGARVRIGPGLALCCVTSLRERLRSRWLKVHPHK